MRKIQNTLRILAYKTIVRYWTRKIDVYQVGYPKTGNTWSGIMLRRMLVKYHGLPDEALAKVLFFRLRQQAWQELPSAVPVIHTTHHMPCFHFESSEEMKLYMAPFKGKKVILLIREPKDTLVSLYCHLRYRSSKFSEDIGEMVHNPIYGIKKYLKYYKTWHDYRALPSDLLLVRYEDHCANPAQIVRKTVRFLGVNNFPEESVEDVVSFSNFKNMRTIEKDNLLKIPSLVPPTSGGQDGFKVRKGKVGGYKEYLDEETIRYIDELVMRELPAFYGYKEGEKRF